MKMKIGSSLAQGMFNRMKDALEKTGASLYVFNSEMGVAAGCINDIRFRLYQENTRKGVTNYILYKPKTHPWRKLSVFKFIKLFKMNKL